MDREEYTFNKNELLRRKVHPYIFHNDMLAKEFYEEFREEVPTAKLYRFPETEFIIAFQAITYDQRAEMRLLEQIGDMEFSLSNTVMTLTAVKEKIEKSIQGGESRLIKPKMGM